MYLINSKNQERKQSSDDLDGRGSKNCKLAEVLKSYTGSINMRYKFENVKFISSTSLGFPPSI